MTFTIRQVVAMAAVTLLATAAARSTAAGSPLIDAIRANDLKGAQTAIAAGADVNAADDRGATPLMYAALFDGPDFVKALVDRGANVNAANKYGSTALMWAAGQTPNVKLLLDRGADVKARATGGVTALVVATRFGNGEAMRLLIAAGSDLKTQDTRAHLITGAYGIAAPAGRDILRANGVVPASSADFTNPVMARMLSVAGPDYVSRLLDSGADPGEQVPLITLSMPTFFMASRAGHVEAMRAFVAHGVDPKAVGPRGWTPLMLAAGGDTPSIKAMQQLLDWGVVLNAKDEDGRTALDWAETRGDTETVSFLKTAGATHGTFVPTVATPTVASPRSAAEAIERALARVQPVGPTFSDRTKCNSCHNQNIPGVAVAMAKRHGLRLDENLVGHSMKVTEVGWRGRLETVALGDVTGGGFQPNISYGFLEMAEGGVASSLAGDVMLLGLASKQMDDGSWPEGVDIRPPLTADGIVSTALAIRALREFAPAGRRSEMQARVVRGRDFLVRAAPRDSQDAAFRLLGLVWSGAPSADIARARADVLELQRADGGWGQMPTLASDAYASSLSLYALHAAGVAASDATYRRGTDYLLRTQLEDGTWFVRTRAFGFQPYFETGFPHGRSQFISTVATAWASVALSYTLGEGGTR